MPLSQAIPAIDSLLFHVFGSFFCLAPSPVAAPSRFNYAQREREPSYSFSLFGKERETHKFSYSQK